MAFWPAFVLLLSVARAGDRREAVLDLLQSFDEPVSKADLAKLGAGVEQELMAIGDDPSLPATRRGNAIVALQWFGTDPVRTWLVGHLRGAKGAGASPILRRKAATALAAFGAGVVAELAAVLTDDDAQLRLAAVRSLSAIADPAARKAIEGRAAVETDVGVKAAIALALGR